MDRTGLPAEVVDLAIMEALLEARREYLGTAVDTIVEAIALADRTLKEAGFTAPRIAVAAINPHAGDGGQIDEGAERVIIELKVDERHDKEATLQSKIDSVTERGCIDAPLR